MEPLALMTTIILSIIHVVFSHSMYIAYRRWLTEQDLLNRCHAACEQLKIAGASVRDSGAVSYTDIDRFAQAMSDIRFLFDKDLERLAGGIYDALLKKHALDSLVDKVAGRVKSATDVALIEKAQKKSQELSGQITNGIYKEMPEHVGNLTRLRLSMGPDDLCQAEAEQLKD